MVSGTGNASSATTAVPLSALYNQSSATSPSSKDLSSPPSSSTWPDTSASSSFSPPSASASSLAPLSSDSLSLQPPPGNVTEPSSSSSLQPSDPYGQSASSSPDLSTLAALQGGNGPNGDPPDAVNPGVPSGGRSSAMIPIGAAGLGGVLGATLTGAILGTKNAPIPEETRMESAQNAIGALNTQAKEAKRYVDAQECLRAVTDYTISLSSEKLDKLATLVGQDQGFVQSLEWSESHINETQPLTERLRNALSTQSENYERTGLLGKIPGFKRNKQAFTEERNRVIGNTQKLQQKMEEYTKALVSRAEQAAQTYAEHQGEIVGAIKNESHGINWVKTGIVGLVGLAGAAIAGFGTKLFLDKRHEQAQQQPAESVRV